nr:uncharacterized protein LOC107442114 [Parasteatoda tepidariorum]
MASNTTESQVRGPSVGPTLQQILRQTNRIAAMKGLPGLESVLGVMGPLALAAMISLPFVAPAAAAFLPLASISGAFGRRRRHLDDPRESSIPKADALIRRIHAAALRRNNQ